jgi:hypothetical protein
MTEEVHVERMHGVSFGPRPKPLHLTIAKHGVSFGMTLAMVCSFTQHRSVLWAIIHGFLSWIYVVYYAIAY